MRLQHASTKILLSNFANCFHFSESSTREVEFHNSLTSKSPSIARSLMQQDGQARGSKKPNNRTKRSRRPRILSNSKNAEPVWRLPTLQVDQFFAAAFFLYGVQKNQKPQNRKREEGDADGLVAEELEKQLLDGIALLFARFKGKQQNASKQSSVQHVTATAMEKREQCFIVYIAKNNGPQEMDDLSDKDFAQKLTAWFGKDLSEESDRNMLQEMNKFWQQRQKYYEDGAKRIWKRHFQNDSNKAFETVLKHGDTTDLKTFKDRFQEDCEDVRKLMESLMEPSDSRSNCDTDKFKNLRRQSYEELKHTESQEAISFRKLIKFLKLFGTIPIFWGHSIEFRKRTGYRNVKLEFLEAQNLENFPLSTAPIIGAIESWNMPHISSDPPSPTSGKKNYEAVKTFEEEKQDAVARVRNCNQSQGKINRYFHCELQLLDKFLGNEAVVNYFGCSKLSCFMCWGVLEGTRFSTRDTHAKIYPGCAFPFGIQKGADYSRLTVALKRVQDLLLDKVLRRAVDPDHALTQYDALTETNPPDNLTGEDRWRELKAEHAESRKIPFTLPPPARMEKFGAIVIRQGGKVELSEITCYNVHGLWDIQKYHEPIHCSSSEYWVSDIQRETEGQNENYSGYWANGYLKVLLRLRNESGDYQANNEWAIGVARSSNKFFDCDDLFPWKGDIYLFHVDKTLGFPQIQSIHEGSREKILAIFREGIDRPLRLEILTDDRRRLFKKLLEDSERLSELSQSRVLSRHASRHVSREHTSQVH